MKKRIPYIYLLMLTFFACACNQKTEVNADKNEVIITKEIKPIQSASENNQSDLAVSIKMPEELDYSNFIEDGFCEKWICVKEKFYPVGWTTEGLFIYYTETPPSFAGTIITVVVQNLTTDKIIHKKTWEGEVNSLKEFWKEKRDDVANLFQRFEIKKTAKVMPLLSFPLTVGNITYQSKLEESRYQNGLIKMQKLIIETSSKGDKEVDIMRQQEGEFGIVSSTIVGCFQSPIENKIAILKLNMTKGIENTGVLGIELVGCQLERGFK